MEDNSMSNNNMDLTNNEIFRFGMEVGRKQLADHIQYQFEIGKPVEVNGELYWLKDAKQNLMDIMDDIESAWHEEHGVIVDKSTRGDRKDRVYNFIVEFIKKNGYAPSVREICVGTNLNSTSNVYAHLMRLENEGKIEVK